jgi:hypothetical protein
VTTFGLVHGAWHGAWCWDLVAAGLRDRGHRPVAVDLPTEEPSAGGDAYADVVVDALAGYDDDVVLVAHAAGGLTAPIVARRRPVRALVLISALHPEPGHSFDELARAESDMLMPGLGAGQTGNPDGSSEWQPQAAIATMYPDAPAELAEWAAARLRRQHWQVTQEVTPLDAWPACDVRVVACARDSVVNSDWVRRDASLRFGVEAHVLPGDHAPFLARPAELVDLIAR